MAILTLRFPAHHPLRQSAVCYVLYAYGRMRVSSGFWPVMLIVVFVIAWVAAKVIEAAKKSEEQWREVDKSKLKEWDDDEDS